MPVTENLTSTAASNGKTARDEIALENVEKLHRMVLGKDTVTGKYVEDFYVDMANGVSGCCSYYCSLPNVFRCHEQQALWNSGRAPWNLIFFDSNPSG